MVAKACNLLSQLTIGSLNPICPLPHASFLTYEILEHLKTGVWNKHHLAPSSDYTTPRDDVSRLLSSAYHHTPPDRHRRFPTFRDTPGIKAIPHSVTLPAKLVRPRAPITMHATPSADWRPKSITVGQLPCSFPATNP